MPSPSWNEQAHAVPKRFVASSGPSREAIQPEATAEDELSLEARRTEMEWRGGADNFDLGSAPT